MNTAYQHGWGVPIATDTAFSLGILSCFKRAVPKSLFSYIAAIAIIDDIGAIIVIAVFYSAHLNISELFYAAAAFVILLILNLFGIRKAIPYILVGLVMWYFIESAGIHGSVAGVLIAFAIPARPKKSETSFLIAMQKLMKQFKLKKSHNQGVLGDQEKHEVLEKVQAATRQTTTPLQRWESNLNLPVSLIILPLFALVNAGVKVQLALVSDIFHSTLAIGIVLALVVGKPVGILFFTKLCEWFRLAKLPDDVNYSQYAGAACLTGVGFTMSIFVSYLSFQSQETLLLAKISIMIASLIAAVVGIAVLLFSKKTPQLES